MVLKYFLFEYSIQILNKKLGMISLPPEERPLRSQECIENGEYLLCVNHVVEAGNVLAPCLLVLLLLEVLGDELFNHKRLIELWMGLHCENLGVDAEHLYVGVP